MARRDVLDETTTPDGQRLELARQGDDFTIRVGGVLLMSSATYGSEQAMALIAADIVGHLSRPRVLVGGLGMGFTLRALLDRLGPDADIVVAELLPDVIRYNQGPLAHLADRPVEDPRVTLVEGDVRHSIAAGGWDAILLDVDNGPGAMTAKGNASLYHKAGVVRLARALNPKGVVVIWSASPSPDFVERLKRAKLSAESRRVYARADARKGPRHTLFIGKKR